MPMKQKYGVIKKKIYVVNFNLLNFIVNNDFDILINLFK